MPITTDLDRVRLLIGDTDMDDPILSDDEIESFLTDRTITFPTTGGSSTNVPAAAADAAGACAAKYARQFDFSEDTQSFMRSQRVSHFTALADDLRSRAGGVSVRVGGTVSS